jgi:glycosyltransferase involved in cell wall biosynthesis
MQQLTGLLPVRNGENYLPLFLQEGQRYLDAVYALDDGSNDHTLSLLQQSALVQPPIIAHPRRHSYAGWNDLENRNKLLRLLSQKNYTGWVLFLDADELLDGEDALLLRQTINQRELDTNKAYGLRVFRMVNDLEHYYKNGLMVYRLFYFRPGYEIQGARLHFEPIPAQIPENNWQPTNLRIKHRSALTPALRRQRYKKYAEADPHLECQPSYENLLDEPKQIHHWSQTRYQQLFLTEP